MKGQALAIAMVVAAGIAMFVMYLSNFESLRATQQAYYERQRFADVFASLKRAPLARGRDIAAIPGVSAIETRVVANVTLDLDGSTNPPPAGWSRSPPTRRPRVNDLFLRRGRWIEPGRPRRGAGERGVRHRARPRAGRSRSAPSSTAASAV